MAKRVDYKCDVDLHNRFDVVVVDAKTRRIKQRAVGFNVICNSLWTWLTNISTGTWNAYIHYGEGTGTPSATDTSLFTFIASAASSDITIAFDETAGVASCTRKIQLSESTAVGKTITEVGIGTGTGANTLVTHAMLQDMNGNPISITKTDTDIINIYASVFLHWTPHVFGDATIEYFPAATPTNANAWVRWILGAGNSNDIFSSNYKQVMALNGVHAGGVLARKSYSMSGNAASKTIIVSSGRFGIDDANESGIKQIGIAAMYWNTSDNGANEFSNLLAVVKSGSTMLPKSQIVNESVGIGDGNTTLFKTKFDCPYNATVYVNGVQAQNVVVYKRPSRVQLAPYVEVLDPSSTKNNIKGGDPTCRGIFSTSHKLSTTSLEHDYFIYNPWYEIGIDYIGGSYINAVYGSNDFENWVSTGSSLSGADRNYKYYKIHQQNHAGTYNNSTLSLTTSSYSGMNIEFSTPPAVGDVITIDYDTDVIPKDSEHVYDFSLTLTFGEWSGNN